MLDINKPKIICHNMTFKGIEIVPGIFEQDQRGIVCAENSDILITKTKPEEDYIIYLENLGWNFSNVNFLSPSDISDYSYNSVFLNDGLIDKLRPYSNTHYLDTYHLTGEEEKFASVLDIELYGNVRLAEKYGTKSGFRKIAKQIDIPIPEGYEGIRTVKEAVNAIEELFDSGYSEVVIKTDEGATGVGLTKIIRHNWRTKDQQEKKNIVSNAIKKVPQAVSSSGCVIEAWIIDVIHSPGILVQVYPNGSHEIITVHEQILDKEKRFVGSFFPVSSLEVNKKDLLKKIATKFCKVLIKEGFMGFFSLDSVISKSGDLYFVEANIRKPGTFYPSVIVKKVNDNSLNDISYIYSHIYSNYLVGRNFNYLKNLLNNFCFSNNEGIILFNTGALSEIGKFDIISISSSHEKAHSFLEKIKSKIGN